MPVPYCLGIRHDDVAGPATRMMSNRCEARFSGWSPELSLGELSRVPSFTWTDGPLSTHVLARTPLRRSQRGESLLQNFRRASGRNETTPRLWIPAMTRFMPAPLITSVADGFRW